MRFLTVIVGVLLVASLSEAAVVQRRIYRNTEEVLVPVTVIQDGEEIQKDKDVNVLVVQPQVKNTETGAIAEDIAKAVDAEQKLESVEAVIEAQRRFDEAVVEEEIKEAVAEENTELLKAVVEEENIEKELIEAEKEAERKTEQQLKSVPEIPQEAVIKPEVIKAVAEDGVKVVDEPIQPIKSVLVEKEIPDQVVVVVETSDEEQPDGSVRQATQATPAQPTTPQNFIQQFLSNLPGAQLFNQITGQTQQGQGGNDEGANTPAAPSPTIPGFLNPFTNAAQSAFNSTTQAFQGIQQFTSSLGSQFQNTLSSLTGQQQQGANGATTARPPGPIQQFVNTIIGGNQQQAQPAPGQQQGPLQGLLNIFQSNNRPQGAAVTNVEPQPAKEPEIIEQTNDAAVDVSPNTADILENEVRDSAEVADSFEESVRPDEIIVVNDDEKNTGYGQERAHVPK